MPAAASTSIHFVRRARLPWRAAGLTERQAAAHLLSRLTFGARPGDVERVLDLGLERWLDRQLAAEWAEPVLAARGRSLAALSLSGPEIARRYPRPALLLAAARRAGIVPAKGKESGTDRRGQRTAALRWAREQGYEAQSELVRELLAWKLWRTVLAENQLAEVLADFWFNHFNVSLTNRQARGYVFAYERDAIRPHALGRFRDLLGAIARHPAMLFYLDNARSTANAGAPTTLALELTRRAPSRFGDANPGRRFGAYARPADLNRKRSSGLNENYGRELLELHTLGVDGGYGQEDVIAVARAFTGWTVVPPFERARGGDRLARLGGRNGHFDEARQGGLGFVRDGDFLFRADAHDAGEKTILGHRLPAGRGIEDGEEVLDLLAEHSKTAERLAAKIAARFVADRPPSTLVARLAKTFRDSRGDVRSVVSDLVSSPEFWDPEARSAKIKSPLELAASALRALEASLIEPEGAVAEIARMGQSLYAYQAPTGYPDRAQEWVNTGSLLARMNFGLEVAADRVPGVIVDLDRVFGEREPASLAEALRAAAAHLLPERDAEATARLLEPLLAAPGLAARVRKEAPPHPTSGLEDTEADFFAAPSSPSPTPSAAGRAEAGSPLAEAVGWILGSPEFQRR